MYYIYQIYCYALHHPALLNATKRFSHNPEKLSLAIAVLVFTTIDKMKYSIVSKIREKFEDFLLIYNFHTL